jgi:hypothetical protein
MSFAMSPDYANAQGSLPPTHTGAATTRLGYVRAGSKAGHYLADRSWSRSSPPARLATSSIC